MSLPKSALLLCFFLTIGACGYRFIPEGDSIDKNIQKVFVDIFTNKTSEANIENTFRTAFIDQISQGRRFKLASSRARRTPFSRGVLKVLTQRPCPIRQQIWPPRIG